LPTKLDMQAKIHDKIHISLVSRRRAAREWILLTDWSFHSSQNPHHRAPLLELHCKFVVLCFSTLSFVNSDTTIFNRRRLFLRMFFNIQCIIQKEKPSFTVSEGHGHPLV
jgi:hypothetical protein